MNVDDLLTPISDEQPAGPDLEYDPDFLEFERSVEGKPEQRSGDSVKPAEPPNWSDVRSRCESLLARTRDLRLLVWYCIAQIETRGFGGLRDALEMIQATLEQLWPNVHPQLDPDDNDPLIRTNVVASLGSPAGAYGDPIRLVQRIRETPLTNSRQIGRFSLRDVAIAAGTVAVTESEDEAVGRPNGALIEAAFDDTPSENLQATLVAAEGAAECMSGIAAAMSSHVGEDKSPDLSPPIDALKEAADLVRTHLSRRGVIDEAAGEDSAPKTSNTALGGDIRSRQDVLAALDRICRYYAECEPSSPVPLLLNRARHLVQKSFVEIVQDLTPDAISQLQIIGGKDVGSSDD